jgi:uncharacterized membrane protein
VRGHRDLRLTTAVAVACALLALLIPVEALSLLFVAPLAFLLPGYAIVATVFVRKPLAVPQLLTLSIGLSLAVLALGALVLNYAPGGVRGFSWAFLLAVVTAGACRGAALRRPAAGRQRILVWPRLSKSQTAFYAAAALSASAALVLAFATLPANEAIGYTELWMQPYAAEGGGVQIGVGSNEKQRTAYRLRVNFGANDAAIVRRFALQPGESRVLRLSSVPAGADAQRVAAALFRADLPDRPYRRVTAWTPAGRVAE